MSPTHVHVRTGATAAVIAFLADGDWHKITEIDAILKPYGVTGSADASSAGSDVASQLRCERMGIKGRDDQQVRWRPDVFLENSEKGHERQNFSAGASAVLKALLGLRSFQQLLVQPGQQLNPAQRFWLDKALAMTAEKIGEGAT
jgi:hypothetical protein